MLIFDSSTMSRLTLEPTKREIAEPCGIVSNCTCGAAPVAQAENRKAYQARIEQ